MSIAALSLALLSGHVLYAEPIAMSQAETIHRQAAQAARVYDGSAAFNQGSNIPVTAREAESRPSLLKEPDSSPKLSESSEAALTPAPEARQSGIHAEHGWPYAGVGALIGGLLGLIIGGGTWPGALLGALVGGLIGNLLHKFI